MNKWIIGSFYTKNSKYEAIYKKYLLPSLESMKENYPNLQWIVRATENTHNWHKNVAQKPLIIKEILRTLHLNECLVFLDADATIEQYPILFDKIPDYCDIAFHVLDWKAWYGSKQSTRELLTGTMFFRNNEKVLALCDKWYQKTIENYEWEQKALQKIINSSNIVYYELPVEYTFIKSRPGGLEPLIKTDPVILHHQVSRDLKRSVL